MSFLIRASREIKNELGQFLNSDFGSKQSLGHVGYYRGKHVEFDWQTSLDQLGVSVPKPSEQYQIDQFYNSKGAVSIRLVGSVPNTATIKLDFARRAAIAAESYKLRSVAYDLPTLGKALRDFVKSNSWDRHWVILTRKYATDGFSFVLSGNKSASIEISATVKSPVRFNIADITLKPSIKTEKLLEYRVVAAEEIEPFFVVHKFLPKRDGTWVLQKYAQKDIYDYWG